MCACTQNKRSEWAQLVLCVSVLCVLRIRATKDRVQLSLCVLRRRASRAIRLNLCLACLDCAYLEDEQPKRAGSIIGVLRVCTVHLEYARMKREGSTGVSHVRAVLGVEYARTKRTDSTGVLRVCIQHCVDLEYGKRREQPTVVLRVQRSERVQLPCLSACPVYLE